jgi:hypothetical protein
VPLEVALAQKRISGFGPECRSSAARRCETARGALLAATAISEQWSIPAVRRRRSIFFNAAMAEFAGLPPADLLDRCRLTLFARTPGRTSTPDGHRPHCSAAWRMTVVATQCAVTKCTVCHLDRIRVPP